MPRLTVEASNEAYIDFVNELYEEQSIESDYFDFCYECAVGVEGEGFYSDDEEHEWLTLSVDIPPSVDFGLFEIDHPPYEDVIRYTCVACGCALNHTDN